MKLNKDKHTLWEHYTFECIMVNSSLASGIVENEQMANSKQEKGNNIFRRANYVGGTHGKPFTKNK